MEIYCKFKGRVDHAGPEKSRPLHASELSHKPHVESKIQLLAVLSNGT